MKWELLKLNFLILLNQIHISALLSIFVHFYVIARICSSTTAVWFCTSAEFLHGWIVDWHEILLGCFFFSILACSNPNPKSIFMAKTQAVCVRTDYTFLQWLLYLVSSFYTFEKGFSPNTYCAFHVFYLYSLSVLNVAVMATRRCFLAKVFSLQWTGSLNVATKTLQCLYQHGGKSSPDLTLSSQASPTLTGSVYSHC